MPFDEREHARLGHDIAVQERGRRPVAMWLLAICAMIFVMIALGGATRLTGSGLSIMEWAPLSGALPPTSEAEWGRLFDLYRQIPQYVLVNAGFGVEGFKQIFWLEWIHRAWGRLIGVVFLVPLVYFWATGRIGRELRWQLLLIFVLGGLQGAVGWFMVASGFFADSTSVSPYRLVVHLALALILYAAILWTALGLLRPRPPGVPDASRPRALVRTAVALIALTLLAGGFVAGIRAGFDYNTFPLMDGHLIPADYARLTPLLRNMTENVASVQFNHRLLATLTLAVTTAAVIAGLRARLPDHARAAILALGAAVAVQYTLGVWTLLSVVPASLGTAHQAMAVLVLTAAVVALHALRGPPAGRLREAAGK